MKLEKEEKIAILISRDSNCPLRGIKIYCDCVGDWSIQGYLYVERYGVFEIDFTIDLHYPYLGFQDDNVFQCDFKFNKDKSMAIKQLKAFSDRIETFLDPFLEYLKGIEEQVKD